MSGSQKVFDKPRRKCVSACESCLFINGRGLLSYGFFQCIAQCGYLFQAQSFQQQHTNLFFALCQCPLTELSGNNVAELPARRQQVVAGLCAGGICRLKLLPQSLDGVGLAAQVSDQQPKYKKGDNDDGSFFDDVLKRRALGQIGDDVHTAGNSDQGRKNDQTGVFQVVGNQAGTPRYFIKRFEKRLKDVGIPISAFLNRYCDCLS